MDRISGVSVTSPLKPSQWWWRIRITPGRHLNLVRRRLMSNPRFQWWMAAWPHPWLWRPSRAQTKEDQKGHLRGILSRLSLRVWLNMGDLHLLVNLMGTASAFGVYQLQLHWSIPAQVAGGDGSPYTAGPGTPTGGQFRLRACYTWAVSNSSGRSCRAIVTLCYTA